MARLSNIFIFKCLVLLCVGSFCACGGDGSSESGMLVQGQLTQGASDAHNNSFIGKHSAEEPIENVTICILAACSLTDAEGKFGLVLPESFTGGEVFIDVNGHGIDSGLAIDIPESTQDVFVHMEHEDGSLNLHHLTYDGVAVEVEEMHAESEHSDNHAE